MSVSSRCRRRNSTIRVLLIAAALCAGQASAQAVHWSDTARGDIIAALASNHATGCGEFWWREYAGSETQLTVYCTADGEEWTGWLVSPAIRGATKLKAVDPWLLDTLKKDRAAN